MESIYFKIANASVFISVVFAILAIFIFPKMKRVFHLFLVFIIFSGSIDLISVIFAEYKMNNLRFIHLYTFLEFGILSVFFNKVTNLFRSKIDLKYIYIPALCLFVLNSFFLQGIDIYNSYSATLGSILIIGYCIYSFYLLLDFPMNSTSVNLKWLIIGIFITHSVLLVIMLSGNVILNISSEYRLVIWTIRAAVFVLTKMLFLFVLIRELRQTSQLSLNGRR